MEATVPLTGGQAGQGISGWSQYDEYGNQLTTPVNTGVTSYGWKGAAQRALDAESGLILMGVRVYNSVTGSFTSVDPVAGGNTTAYAYPQDPINKEDLDGKWAKKAARWLTDSKWGRRIGIACSFAWGGVGTLCNGVYAAAYASQGRWGQAAMQFVPGGIGCGVAKTVPKTVGKKINKKIFGTKRVNRYSRSTARYYNYRGYSYKGMKNSAMISGQLQDTR